MKFTSPYVFAYYTIHNKFPPGKNPLLEPPTVDIKPYRSFLIETVLEDSWLETLSNFENKTRQIISLSSGRSKLYLAHIIINMLNIKQEHIDILFDRISSYFDIHLNHIDLSDRNKMICIATKNWYRYGTSQNSNWERWWNNISNIFKQEEIWRI